MRIILASKSPRRREILDNIGLDFEVIESNFDENIGSINDPAEIVKYLAYEKAKKVADSVKEDALIIGADTIVVCDNIIMGKPVDEHDSFDMLKRLSNRWHNVYSGVCVINLSTNKYSIGFENTAVKIKELSDDEILYYISTKEPVDKAGAYITHDGSKVSIEVLQDISIWASNLHKGSTQRRLAC